MEKTAIALSVPEQVRKAMDGRTIRWLALEIKMPETELSKRMNGHIDFKQEEINSINARLNSKIRL